MAYLSFWLAGYLRCYEGGGHPSRLVASLSPLAVSIWIGITRLQVETPLLVPILITWGSKPVWCDKSYLTQVFSIALLYSLDPTRREHAPE